MNPGDVALVPPYDTSLLVGTDFQSVRTLIPTTPPTRTKGWRASPLWDAAAGGAFSVRLMGEAPARSDVQASRLHYDRLS